MSFFMVPVPMQVVQVVFMLDGRSGCMLMPRPLHSVQATWRYGERPCMISGGGGWSVVINPPEAR